METITSRTNPLITHIRKLTVSRKTRRSQGLMVCEGPKMLGEALRWGGNVGYHPMGSWGRTGGGDPLRCGR